MAGINVNDPANRNVRRDFPTGLISSDRGVGLKVSWTLPNDATLMSITSWSKYLANDFRDQDFTDQPTIAAPARPCRPSAITSSAPTTSARRRRRSATSRRTPAPSNTWPACGWRITKSTATSSAATASRR
jgi:hypothetical protein